MLAGPPTHATMVGTRVECAVAVVAAEIKLGVERSERSHGLEIMRVGLVAMAAMARDKVGETGLENTDYVGEGPWARRTAAVAAPSLVGAF